MTDKQESFFEIAQLTALLQGGRMWRQLVRLLEDRLNVEISDSDSESEMEDTAKLMLRAMSIPVVALLVMLSTNENTKVSFTDLGSMYNSAEGMVWALSTMVEGDVSKLQQAIMASEVTMMGYYRMQVGSQTIAIFKYGDDTDTRVGAIVFDDNSIKVCI